MMVIMMIDSDYDDDYYDSDNDDWQWLHDGSDCDEDSNYDDGWDIVCITRMISTVYDDDSDFEEDFCSIWRLLESILGPFCAHVGALGRLGGQDLKKLSSS